MCNKIKLKIYSVKIIFYSLIGKERNLFINVVYITNQVQIVCRYYIIFYNMKTEIIQT